MKTLAAVVFAFWCVSALNTQCVYAQQHLVDISYEINARLDTQQKKIFGEAKIRFKNGSGATLQELYLHLKPNRLREGSIQGHTMGSSFMDLLFPSGPADGYLFVQELKLDGNDYETGKNAQLDDTVLKLNLDSPIETGNYGELAVQFVLKIPNSLERLGHFRENYYLSWWYPELAVLDKNGWHLDPFREPYQNFGSYTVALTVPQAMVVGATGGFPENETQNQDGTKTLRFSVQNVHDFAWVADKRYQIEDTEWQGIKIRSLYFPENAETGRRTAQYSKDAIEYFSKRFGPYPYPTFTAVQFYGLVLGAMEYPQLVMNGNLLYKLPKQSTVLDIVNAHEIGHQWFYGILMNNQPEETWLDEGFAEFCMIAYAEEKYGPEHNLVDVKQIPELWRTIAQGLIPNWRHQTMLRGYLGPALEGREEPVTTPDSKVRPGRTARYYEKGALTLFALEYLLGPEVFDRILKEYVQRFQFKQVTTSDFEKVVGEISGQDLNWFFDQWLHSTKTIDFVYEMLRVEQAEGKYINRVFVHQAGDMKMPVDVQITLVDEKTKLTQRWEGNEKFGVVTFITDQPAHSAVIDPGKKLPDLNPENNRAPQFIQLSPLISHGSIPGQLADELILGINWELPRFHLNGELGYSLGLEKIVYSVRYEQHFSLWEPLSSKFETSFADRGQIRALRFSVTLGSIAFATGGRSWSHELRLGNFSDWPYNVPQDPGYYWGWDHSYVFNFSDHNGTKITAALGYKIGAWESEIEQFFRRLTLETTLSRRLGWQTMLHTRLFYGSRHNHEPGGATPFSIEREGRFRTFTLYRDELVALNTELRFPIAALNWIDLLILPISIGGTLFADIAQVGIEGDALRAEAGIGLRIGIYRQPALVRIEYPFWVNTDKDGGKSELRVSWGASF
jgi:hypothetical protein